MSVQVPNGAKRGCIACGATFVPWTTSRGIYKGYYCKDCHEDR